MFINNGFCISLRAHNTEDGEMDDLESDKEVLRTLIDNSIAQSTMKKYKSSWSRWTEYATKHNMHILPASPDDISLFLAHLAHSGHKSVCASASAAIAWFHTSEGYPSPSSMALVKTVLSGAERCLLDTRTSNGTYFVASVEKSRRGDLS